MRPSNDGILSGLRGLIEGRVLAAGDPGYDEARRGWNLAVEQSPRVVVDAASETDVQIAVRRAREHGLPVAVMSTGHGTPRACDGMMILTSKMTGVSVDPETRLARVQGGARVKHVLEAAAPYGLAMLSGGSTEVGAVGYTLAGGIGLMVRKHGLAADALRSARIVAPDGSLVEASPTDDPELLWAIRGGGGAFGVVAEMTVELVPQRNVFGGATFYPGEDAEAVLRGWAAWTRTAPEEVSSCLSLANLPDLPSVPGPLRGRAVAIVNACVCGDLVGAEDSVRKLRALGAPLIDAWGEMPYAESGRIHSDPVEPMPACTRGALLRNLSEGSVKRILEEVGPLAGMPLSMLQVRHIGGAVASAPRDGSPLGLAREAEYLAYAVGVPNPFASPAALGEHAEGILDALGGDVVCRGPLAFLGDGDVSAGKVQGVYGEEEHERLLRVKERIDPDNAFRFAGVGLAGKHRRKAR